jgi:hypothetical protein
MVIPDQLTLLLERLYRGEDGSGKPTPPFERRVEIYLQALEFVKKEPRLLDYVLGHRNLVTHSRDCMEVDILLFKLMCLHPSRIPQNFAARLPKRSSLVPYVSKIYWTYHFWSYCCGRVKCLARSFKFQSPR